MNDPKHDAAWHGTEGDASRPFGMLRLLWHVWRHGHAVPLTMTGRGWLYVCECGGVVAR